MTVCGGGEVELDVDMTTAAQASFDAGDAGGEVVQLHVGDAEVAEASLEGGVTCD